MGEPLNNYENVRTAVQFLIDPARFSLSPRHVTISTVGVTKNMFRLTADLPYVNLALSLHAPDQVTRLKIVPTAGAHKIDQLMEAVDNHIEKSRETHRRGKRLTVMIEYILIKDVNDTPAHAHLLGALLKARRLEVLLNLIPYNPTDAGKAENYEAPDEKSVREFWMICTSASYGLFTRMRQEMGQDVNGACGQLAVSNQGSKKETKKDGVVDIEDFKLNQGANSNNSNSSYFRYATEVVAGVANLFKDEETSASHSWQPSDLIAVSAVTTGLILGAFVIFRASKQH